MIKEMNFIYTRDNCEYNKSNKGKYYIFIDKWSTPAFGCFCNNIEDGVRYVLNCIADKHDLVELKINVRDNDSGTLNMIIENVRGTYFLNKHSATPERNLTLDDIKTIFTIIQ